jgi:DNA-binding response OmpR family regulator
MDKPRILVVDDEEHIRRDLIDHLSHRIECELIEAANGYEAVEHLKKGGIDLILLDIKMPGISGTEVIQKAKELASKAAIIVLTKFDSTRVSNQVKESGAEYIPKPYSLKVVRGKVEEKLKARGKFLPKEN